MKIRNLQINHMMNPIGISGENIRITWNLEDCKKQTAYKVKVTTPDGRVLEEKEEKTNRMVCTLDKTIPSRTKANLTVTVMDERGTYAESVAFLVTGIGNAEWTASWINPETEILEPDKRRASYLKETVILTEDQVSKAKDRGAYLYATCHGLMTIAVNGQNITDKRFMPGTQQYNKRLMVETIEVSQFLRAGSNEVLVTLGDGWYRGSMGFSQNKNVYGKDLALLLQMEIDRRVVLKTDTGWMATQGGPIGHNDFMEGEEFDARKELKDAQWHPVKSAPFGFDNLIPRDVVPMVEKERFTATLVTTPKGEKVLDFGQNLVGYVSFSIEAKSGQKLTLIHGEELDGEGNFTIQNFQNPAGKVKQQVDYICKEGRNEYCPAMTYMGFRYVKVETEADIRAEDFTAIAVYSDMRVTSEFTCGVEAVNQLFRNAIWSMKGNFLDVPTDCPTREKSGYSGDCQAYVHTAMYLMDCYSVYAKWIREQAAGQYSNGLVPQIAPKSVPPEKKDKIAGMFVADGGIGWADAFEVVPYRLAKRYGDRSLIKENYQQLKAWTDYEVKRAGKTRLANLKTLPRKYRKYMIDTGWMWGEWLEPGQDDVNYMKELVIKGDPEVGTAFYYLHLSYMAEMAGMLGRSEDQRIYRNLAEKAKEAYRQVYLSEGRVKEEKRQCRFVRPIAHDLLSETEKMQAAKDLAALITKNQNHLNTGFLTTHELTRSLSRNGQKKKAYDLLLQREAPGWLYAVEKGCTTIPESWDCFDEKGNPKNSFNHYSYGAITGWLMDSVCGIRVEDGKISIAPQPDRRLGFARACYDSPYGKIACGWHYEDEKIHYQIEVPANMTADLQLEGLENRSLEAGKYQFEVMEK